MLGNPKGMRLHNGFTYLPSLPSHKLIFPYLNAQLRDAESSGLDTAGPWTVDACASCTAHCQS